MEVIIKRYDKSGLIINMQYVLPIGVKDTIS